MAKRRRIEEDIIDFSDDDVIDFSDDDVIDFSDDMEYVPSKKEVRSKPKIQKHQRIPKPKRQKNNKPIEKPKLTTILIVVVLVGLCGGWILSLFTNGDTSKGDDISNRVADQSNQAIKSTNEDPQKDIATLLKDIPFSKSELKSALIALGHSDATASQAIETMKGYEEPEIISRRIALYLEASGFSSKGLAGRLIADGFDQKTAIEVLSEKNKTIDYTEQAKRRGYGYLEYRVVTTSQMRDALVADGFTKEDVEKALKELPCDD